MELHLLELLIREKIELISYLAILTLSGGDVAPLNIFLTQSPIKIYLYIEVLGIHSFIHSFMDVYIHTYMHTGMHAYIYVLKNYMN